jgi:hypothetical protein
VRQGSPFQDVGTPQGLQQWSRTAAVTARLVRLLVQILSRNTAGISRSEEGACHFRSAANSNFLLQRDVSTCYPAQACSWQACSRDIMLACLVRLAMCWGSIAAVQHC